MRIGVNGWGGPLIVNLAVLLAPLDVVTVMFAAPPGADALIWSLAVICVALLTVTFEITMSGLLEATVAPEEKLKPAIVAVTVAPGEALLGLIDVM